MKKNFSILPITLLVSLSVAFSQNEIAGNFTLTNNSDAVQEKAASFVGGDSALVNYIKENINYPSKARNMGVEGTVILQYFVETDGAIREIFIVKSVARELDEEAYRLVCNMPDRRPGIHHGHPERMCYQLPIRFVIDF